MYEVIVKTEEKMLGKVELGWDEEHDCPEHVYKLIEETVTTETGEYKHYTLKCCNTGIVHEFRK